jgi:hypothetical protein
MCLWGNIDVNVNQTVIIKEKRKGHDARLPGRFRLPVGSDIL